MARLIQFEIDDEVEGHLFALAEAWRKDPIELAKALFVEELMGQTSGNRGVPHSRRYWYRNSDVYFSTEEKEAMEARSKAFWESAEGQALQKERADTLERFGASVERRKQNHKEVEH